MGCVSSSLLNQDEELRRIGIAGSGAIGHHIVSLTSTTYGLLTLDHPPPPPLPSSQSLSESSNSNSTCSPPPPPSTAIPEVINSWELMAGLDNNDSFRFNNSNSNSNSNSCSNSKPPSTPKFFKPHGQGEGMENCDPNVWPPSSREREREKEVILYTTSLRGVRSTFQACNAVRSALHSLGYSFCERDISMDRGFRDELNRMLQDQDQDQTTWGWAPPRLFIRGRYVGGAEELLRMHEDGSLAQLLHGLPKLKLKLKLKTGTGSGSELLCDGCGGFCFLPCFRCHGSCKLVSPNPKFHTYNYKVKVGRRTVVMRCPDCNENGLVLCPLCT